MSTENSSQYKPRHKHFHIKNYHHKSKIMFFSLVGIMNKPEIPSEDNIDYSKYFKDIPLAS